MDANCARSLQIVSDTYPEHLRRAFRSTWHSNLTVIATPSGGYEKFRTDETELTAEQLRWLITYETGYFTAVGQFREAS